MKLLEYEAKKILKTCGVSVPQASLVRSEESPVDTPVVLKSQVPVGGRGKAGGIKIVKRPEEIEAATEALLVLNIKGFKPRVLLAEELLAIESEFYLSLVINRETARIEFLAHTDGGVDIENNDAAGFLKLSIGDTKNFNIIGEQLAECYNLPEQIFALQDMAERLYRCFIAYDVTLLEINPLVLTTSGEFVAGDCKMTLDDAARFRHPNWNFEEETANTNFVTLDQEGTVATIANGAGLAMATVDAVADSGLTPANFLDVGGGADEASVLEAFSKIVEYPNISAIVINIFAGITRCDEVAKAILAAKSKIPKLPKLYVRLAGTNYEAAQTLLEVISTPLLPSLEACIEAIKEDAL